MEAINAMINSRLVGTGVCMERRAVTSLGHSRTVFSRVVRPRRRANLLLITVVALTVATTIRSPSAGADPFGGGPPDQGYQADSTTHTYCYGAGFNTDLRDEADYVMSTLDTTTDMSDAFLTCAPTSTDAQFFDANLPSGVRGRYTCTVLSGNDICLAAELTVDPAQINIGDSDYYDRLKTFCHELGHSVGLQHGATKTDCMINGEIPDVGIQWRRYSTHHIDDHINPTY